MWFQRLMSMMRATTQHAIEARYVANIGVVFPGKMDPSARAINMRTIPVIVMMAVSFFITDPRLSPFCRGV